MSSERPMKGGVPQGSPLSPLLYSTYTADIPKIANARLALYADDTCIYYSARHELLLSTRLQQYIDKLVDYFRKWKVKLNRRKTQAIFITRQYNVTPADLEVEGERIEWSETAKYLGMTLDKRLNFERHIAQKRVICMKTVDSLKPLIRSKKLNLRNKRLIFTQIVRPQLLHGCVAYCQATKTVKNKLQTCQNKAIRRIFDVPWYVRNVDMYEDLQIDSVDKYIQDRALKLFDSVDNIPNISLEMLRVVREPWRNQRYTDLREILD